MDTDADLEISPRAIRNYRMRLGLSRSEAAAKAGLAPKTWYEIENGNTQSCRMVTLRRIAEGLDVEVSALLVAVPPAPREGVA